MARIVVVEDEPITAADLEQKLAFLGHEVAAWADSGEDALERVRALSPDLVLMDIRLRGGMSGIEAAAQLRSESDVPIVFLTAFADHDTVGRACETQPYGYLIKPFTERSVAATVQVALERARVERAQGERERWESLALRSAGEALLAVDKLGAVRFVNETGEALLGVKAADVLGRDARSVVRFAEESQAIHPLDAALHEARVSSSSALWLLKAEGTRLLVSCSAAPVLAANGETKGAVLVFREEQPADARAKPVHDALSALSMQLSHEINNPLTYNLGALNLALRELDELRALSVLGSTAAEPTRAQWGERLAHVEDLLRSAHEGATRVAGVMRELSTFSLSEGKVAPFQTSELLDLAIGMSGTHALAGVTLSRKVSPAPMVRGDKWLFGRILAYVIQSTLGGSERPLGENDALELRVGTDARGWAELVVRRPRSFRVGPTSVRRVVTTKLCDAPSATGVGLAMAVHTVERLGGELIIHAPDEAHVFTFRLPPMSTRSAEDVAHGAARPPSRGSVLVVDDEPMLGRVLEIALEAEYDVTAVQSATSALELLERGDAFDVILCDLTMPEMSGQDLYERLCATKPELASRIIIMSGGALTDRSARFLAGMVGRRIDKPFRATELLPLLAQRVQARMVRETSVQC